jgi:hypothetical protein
MSKKDERKDLIDEIVEMASELEYLEYKLPSSLDKLKKLNPTKKEIEENGLKDLFDVYL